MTTQDTPQTAVYNPTVSQLAKVANTYATGSKLAARAVAMHAIRTAASDAGLTAPTWDELTESVARVVVAGIYSAKAADVLDLATPATANVSSGSLKQASYAADFVVNLGIGLTHTELLGTVVSAFATLTAKGRDELGALVESDAPSMLDGVAVDAVKLSGYRAESLARRIPLALALANEAKRNARAAKAAEREAAAAAAALEADDAESDGSVHIDPTLSAYDVAMIAVGILRDNVPTLDESDRADVLAALEGILSAALISA